MDISSNNIKKNIRFIAYALVAVLTFVFLALPWMTFSLSVSYSKEKIGGSVGFSGYEIMGDAEELDLYDMEIEDYKASAVKSFIKEGIKELKFEPDFYGVVGFFAILIMIVAIVLLIAAIYMLLVKLFGIALPTEFGPVKVEQVTHITALSFAGLNVLTLLIALIGGIANSKSESESGVKATLGMGTGIGLWLMAIFAVGTIVVLKLVIDKLPEFAGTPSARYACEQCGAPAKAGMPFCQKCGGKVVELPPAPIVVYSCEQCGTKAKAGAAFCTKCGGKVVAKEQYPVVHLCTQCGAKAKAGVAFCTKCGGKVEAKELRPEPQAQPQFQQQAQPICPTCGSPVAPGTKFCTKCGTPIQG